MITVILLACAVAVAAPSPAYRVVERTLSPVSYTHLTLPTIYSV